MKSTAMTYPYAPAPAITAVGLWRHERSMTELLTTMHISTGAPYHRKLSGLRPHRAAPPKCAYAAGLITIAAPRVRAR